MLRNKNVDEEKKVLLEEMRKKDKSQKSKLDILNQTRDRTPMPRPTVFKDKKKYDRNVMKDEGRKEKEAHHDD